MNGVLQNPMRRWLPAVAALSVAVANPDDVGSDLANSLAQLLNTTPTQAGYILGGIFIFAFVLVAVIMGSKLEAQGASTAIFLMAAVGLVFARLLNWWPDWALVVAVLFGAIALVGPFRSMGGA